MKHIPEAYQIQAKQLEIVIGNLKRKVNQYSFARLLVFLVAILAVYIFFGYGIKALVLIAITAIAVFLFLVKKQVQEEVLLQFSKDKLRLLENEVNVLEYRENLYDNGNQFSDAKHAYTDDLDIFGPNSVYAYINRCSSQKARRILASYFKEPANRSEILKRQEAIVELGQFSSDTLDYRTRLLSLPSRDIDVLEVFFTDKLAKAMGFIQNTKLKAYAVAVPFLSIALLVLTVFWGGLWFNILGLFLLLNFIVYFFYKARIDFVHEGIGKSSAIFKNYASNLKWIENQEWKADLLKDKTSTGGKRKEVYRQFLELDKILTNLNYRFNIIVAIFLNLFFQWDLRQLRKLYAWHLKSESDIVDGFDTIAQFEVLISLSVLDNNHPEWTYPKIEEGFGFESKELGHPLIEESKRVNNDFSLGERPTADVITGSNMAGKSTFLRTVGVNMVLAFLGAKTCSKAFKSSVFNLYSFMRIKDSLAESTSTFKAEIDRLKMILEETAKDETAFVLIDEMLRGTNSKDKYLGSKAFIERMIQQKTPGFIATHDLQIADLEKDYPSSVRNYHFDISVKDEEMFFDYKIKNGECKTFNASILLKAIGLDVTNGE
ncbi:MutS-related protein [Pseudopedobacter beijingensis]|uniref:DNA mismatch repair protein MutS n=1 Tax=Pseudopedobacter beijingensis TaxID=1207056 RepID=A0ABW4I6S9_9SPHI